MAYHRKYISKYRRQRPVAPMRSRPTFAAQGDDLAKKVVVDGVLALTTRVGANYFCTRPNPDYGLCKAFDDAANKQAEQLQDSLVRLGAWGFVALLAADIEK